MRLLLDAHTFLWFVAGSSELSRPARRLIEDVGNELLLSMASAWEMAIKASIGKLDLDEPFETFLPDQLAINNIALLNIDVRHVLQTHSLPFHHRDPFDRLIISQSLVEDIPVLGRDVVFEAYGVKRKW